MRTIVKLTEKEFHNIIFESVKRYLNEISYDDWKLMSPYDDLKYESIDCRFVVELVTSVAGMEKWKRGFDISDVKIIDGECAVFTITFEDMLP